VNAVIRWRRGVARGSPKVLEPRTPIGLRKKLLAVAKPLKKDKIATFVAVLHLTGGSKTCNEKPNYMLEVATSGSDAVDPRVESGPDFCKLHRVGSRNLNIFIHVFRKLQNYMEQGFIFYFTFSIKRNLAVYCTKQVLKTLVGRVGKK
jgi:hypothetical protein